MDASGYTTLTRQAGLMREMQLVANNIANASTSGFRREGMVFSEHVKRLQEGPSLSMANGNARHIDLTQADLVDFTATVEGQPVEVTIDRIAVVEDGWDQPNPPSKQYDNPGRDVTADLERLGIPLTLDYMTVREVLLTLKLK